MTFVGIAKSILKHTYAEKAKLNCGLTCRDTYVRFDQVYDHRRHGDFHPRMGGK
jgi:hypothetical protein